MITCRSFNKVWLAFTLFVFAFASSGCQRPSNYLEPKPVVNVPTRPTAIPPVNMCSQDPSGPPSNPLRVRLTRAQPTTIAKVCTTDWSGVVGPAAQPLDMVIVQDTTASMDDAIQGWINAIGMLSDDIAGLTSDAHYGLAEFRDWTAAYGGDSGDMPYTLDQALTPSVTDFKTAAGKLTSDGGGDGPESDLEALYQVATGAGDGGFVGVAPSNLGWRPVSSKIVILVTDAEFKDFPSGRNLTRDQVKAALVAKGIKVIGVAVGGSNLSYIESASDLIDMAKATGAVAPSDMDIDGDGVIDTTKGDLHAGDPLVFAWNTDGNSAAVAKSLANLISKGVTAIISKNVDVKILGDRAGLSIVDLDGPKSVNRGDNFCFRVQFTMNPDFSMTCPGVDRDFDLQAVTADGITLGGSSALLNLWP